MEINDTLNFIESVIKQIDDIYTSRMGARPPAHVIARELYAKGLRPAEEVINEFAESLSTYYNKLNGATYAALTAYTITERARAFIAKMEGKE